MVANVSQTATHYDFETSEMIANQNSLKSDGSGYFPKSKRQEKEDRTYEETPSIDEGISKQIQAA